MLGKCSFQKQSSFYRVGIQASSDVGGGVFQLSLLHKPKFLSFPLSFPLCLCFPLYNILSTLQTAWHEVVSHLFVESME